LAEYRTRLYQAPAAVLKQEVMLRSTHLEPTPTENIVSERPLCVDLDGTLIGTDLLWESLLLLIRQRPLALAMLPFYLLRGRAALKRFVALRVMIDAASLPYNLPFLNWLREQKARGRRIVLATASDELLARQVAASCAIFDEVIASDGSRNLKGKDKLLRLQNEFASGFDYAGNSVADRPIWGHAHHAIVVASSRALEEELRGSPKLEAVFPKKRPAGILSCMKALRLHQWSKNLLVFVPILTSHEIHIQPLLRCLVLFIALGCCASALYVANDLLDLESDRKHPRKRTRPFACADLPIVFGMLLMPVLLAASFSIAALFGMRAVLLVLLYCLGSITYSFWLKRRAPLDLFVLTGLYVLRIIAGGLIAQIVLTSWLLAFSMFFFLSLVCCKRVAELVLLRQNRIAEARGRGYGDMDMEQLNVFGVSSAFVSSVILSLYLDSANVRILYSQPAYLWLLVPLFLYWQTRLWTFTWRGQMNDDPVMFAVKDKLSYVLAILIVAIMLVAKFDLPTQLVVWR